MSAWTCPAQKSKLIATFVLLLTVLARPLLAADPIEIASRRELFIDHYLIGSLNGVRLALHRPQPREIVLKFDKPWEGLYSGLSLNYATSAVGGLFVEIQTPDGKPIEGFALADCLEMIGDRIDHTVSWKKGSDVSPLADKPVRLRFAMNDADLYSMQFTSRD